MKWCIFLLGALGLYAQPNLVWNNGAQVTVQSGAYIYVQGGWVNQNNGTYTATVDNSGVIALVNRPGGGWYGDFTNESNAVFNSQPNSWLIVERHYTNRGSYAATGGTLLFRDDQIQNYLNDNPTGAYQHYNVAVQKTGGYVNIVNTTTQDMHIQNTLDLNPSAAPITGDPDNIPTPTQSVIRTNGREVRVYNSAVNAILTAPNPTPANTTTPENHSYIWTDGTTGGLRRAVNANNTYLFPVGGSIGNNTTTYGEGRQDIQIAIGGSTNGFTLVRFAQNQFPGGSQVFNSPIYCRPGDGRSPNTTDYKHLDNGSWYIQEASSATASQLGNIPNGSTRNITMYNRDFANGGASMGIDANTGQCLPAGTPGDDYWPTYRTDLCYIGITGKILTPPNNCEGSNTFFGVSRTGFTSLQLDPSYPWVFSTVNALNSPLPSEDIKLRAVPKGSVISLVWEVSPEREYILGYELERSRDAVTFHRIAQVDKQGRVTYTHDDAYVERGVRYFYRVAQHDALGMVRYSNIAEAILAPSSSQFSYQLYPNPTSGEAYLLVNLPEKGQLGIQVYDAIGKLVMQETYTLSAGTHQISLQEKLAPVASGTYNVSITYGGENFTTRLVKVDRSQ